MKVTTQAEWDRVKKTPIRTKWELRLGRLDSDGEPSKKVPGAGASAEEVRAFYNELGAKPGSTSGPFAGLPPFSEKKSFLLYSAAQDDAAVRPPLACSPMSMLLGCIFGAPIRLTQQPRVKFGLGRRCTVQACQRPFLLCTCRSCWTSSASSIRSSAPLFAVVRFVWSIWLRASVCDHHGMVMALCCGYSCSMWMSGGFGGV